MTKRKHYTTLHFLLLFFITLVSKITVINAQTQNNLTTFNRPTLSQLIQLPSTPQPASFQQIDITQFALKPNLPNNYNNSPLLNPNYNQLQMHQATIQQAQAAELWRQQQLEEIKKDVFEFETGGNYNEYMNAAQPFFNAYDEFLKLNPDNFSITKAIYLVENAVERNKFSYEQFENAIKLRAELVKQILKREGITSNNNSVLNYGIQKLFSKTNSYYNPKTKQTVAVKPFTYDHNDYKGVKNYQQLFVSKLLKTGKGQCHSLPLLYLTIAEQLGAKAYLSLAPEHSFIQYFNTQGDRLSFEATNGNIVSSNWMLQSGFINSASLKNKIFLDTLSQRKLYARCLTDLLLAYQNQFGYDGFTNQIKEKIKQFDNANITVSIIEENMATQNALQKIKAAGSPPLKDLPNYPDAYNAYLKMQESYKQTDDLGFQEMPKEAYQRWLKSIDKEKKKQETREAQYKMQQEIQMLKKLKTKITFTPIG
jgi:hypothetical protein